MKFRMKLMAVFAVAMMLAVCFAGVIATENTSAVEEKGTVVPLIDGEGERPNFVISGSTLLIIIAASGIAGGVASFLYFGQGINNPPDTSPQNRRNEIENFSNIMATGTAWNTNTIKQIKQIWGFTNEHWIRQCELATAQIWSKGTSFSDYRTWILDRSGTYYNSAVMVQNAFEQLNESYKGIGVRLDNWKDAKYGDTYKDIKMGFTLNDSDGLIMESNEYWNATILSCAMADGDKNMVYISGGNITPFVNGSIAGADSKIQRVFLNNERNMQYGEVITVKANQTTNLDSIADFKPGVYILPKNVMFAGNITPTYDGDQDATVYPGYVIKSGSKDSQETKLVYYDSKKITDQRVIYNGEAYSTIELSAQADGVRTVVSDLTTPLEDMQTLLETTKKTIMSAISSASAVWSIYTKAGEPSTYVSTLLFSDVTSYDNVELNDTTKEILTIMAMGQMASYYDTNQDKLLAGTYTMSTSMSVYMLGSIKVGDGDESYYEDVIFTPYINEYSQTFKNGENKIDQYTQVAIWKSNYKNNTIDWDERPGEVELKDTSLINIGANARFFIRDILVFDDQGNPDHPTEFDMKVKEMQHIDPEKLPTKPLDPVVVNGSNIAIVVMIIMAILGLVGVIYGLKTGNYIVLAIGVVVIVAGFFVSGPIADFIGRFT